MNGLNKAEASKNVYNLRHGKTNHQRAQELGYLDSQGRVPQPQRQWHAGFRSGLAQAILRKRQSKRHNAEKLLNFAEAWKRRYGQALRWLELDPKGWDVNHSISPQHYEDIFKQVFTRRGKQNKVRHFNKIKTTTGKYPKNFALYYSDKSPGLGAWFPYEHDHHHLIPVGTFQDEVVGKSSTDPGITYMKRADVVMQSNWNIHNSDNVMLLPRETYAAHILNLPAHLPWQMRANHEDYSMSFKQRLNTVRVAIDNALTSPGSAEERHKLVAEAASDIQGLLTQMSKKTKTRPVDFRLHHHQVTRQSRQANESNPHLPDSSPELRSKNIIHQRHHHHE